MLVHKEGDWMTGPLELRDTHIAFAAGGAPLWRAGLSGSSFGISLQLRLITTYAASGIKTSGIGAGPLARFPSPKLIQKISI